MTTEQKIQALQALSRVSFLMRKPGDWCASWERVEIGGDGMLRGLAGNGPTPFDAGEDLWAKATSIGDALYLTPGGYDPDRKHYRWNGYMWREVPR
jgi:hypothetical protein